METQNNEIKETTFTQEDILKTLLTLDERIRSYIISLKFAEIERLANDTEYLKNAYDNCDYYMEYYDGLRESIETFVGALMKLKENDTYITFCDMVKKYEKLPEEEQIAFLKEVSGKRTFMDAINKCKRILGKD